MKKRRKEMQYLREMGEHRNFLRKGKQDIIMCTQVDVKCKTLKEKFYSRHRLLVLLTILYKLNAVDLRQLTLIVIFYCWLSC